MIGVYTLITLISYCTFSLVEMRSQDRQIKQFARIVQIACFMFALLLAVTSPALADCGDRCVVADYARIGDGPDGPSLVAAEVGSYGEVHITYVNNMVMSLSVSSWVLIVDGVEVHGLIVARSAEAPDDLEVVPPVGYFCDPCTITVSERDTGAVVLYPEVGV